jgi:DNA replication and repair protein RecF
VRVAHLGLTDFRNYADLEVDLDPAVTVLLGPNGQGKTNVVEAVAYLATFSSHRVATDAALVRAGADRAVIRSQVTQGDRTLGLDVQINPGRANRIQVNRAPVRRTRDALGIVRAVMFAPEDLALAKGEPAGRRRFLDDLLLQLAPRYASVIADYDKALRQRNSLLRTAAKSGSEQRHALHSTLQVWDDRLVSFGSELAAGRAAIVDRLREPVATAYAQVAPARNAVGMSYVASRIEQRPASAAEFAEALRQALGAARAEEMARGVTVVGPHRDELDLSLNDLPARGYASHGECWSLALALRLASYDLLRDEAAGDPVLILDDVFAELDQQRRDRLAAWAGGAHGQVLITAAVSADVPNGVSGVRFCVDNGSVRREWA